jgi:hypothetical protein
MNLMAGDYGIHGIAVREMDTEPFIQSRLRDTGLARTIMDDKAGIRPRRVHAGYDGGVNIDQTQCW